MAQVLFYEDRSKQHNPNSAEEEQNSTSARRHGGERKRTRADRIRPAWIDEDDDPQNGLSVDVKAVKRNRKLRESASEKKIPESVYQQRIRDYYARESRRIGQGTWAELPSEKLSGRASALVSGDGDLELETSDSDQHPDGDTLGADADNEAEILMRSTGPLCSVREQRAKGSSTLRSGVLDIRQVKDANLEDRNRSVVNALEFHPSGRLLLTGGLDSTLRIFHVDGKRNSKVQGVHFRDMPIHRARFSGGGEQVIVSGRRSFFYQFDLGSGTVERVLTLERNRHSIKSLENFVVSHDGQQLAFIGGKGHVHIVSNKTKQQTGVLHLNEACGAACFSAHNEHHILTTGKGGNVYLWDVRTYACLDRHVDEGALTSTAIASSGSHYAIGHDSGVVNVYKNACLNSLDDMTSHDEQRHKALGRRETPERALLNLSTSINAISFNFDGNLLAIASRVVKDAVKIVHVPSLTVYGNWPTRRVILGRASSLAFSPKGGYLAVGNDRGRALLFRIRDGYAPN